MRGKQTAREFRHLYHCFPRSTYLCNLCLMDFHVGLGILKTSAHLNKIYFTSIFCETRFNIFLMCHDIGFVIKITILLKISLFYYFYNKLLELHAIRVASCGHDPQF